jgi:hypothetical protein
MKQFTTNAGSFGIVNVHNSAAIIRNSFSQNITKNIGMEYIGKIDELTELQCSLIVDKIEGVSTLDNFNNIIKGLKLTNSPNNVNILLKLDWK